MVTEQNNMKDPAPGVTTEVLNHIRLRPKMYIGSVDEHGVEAMLRTIRISLDAQVEKSDDLIIITSQKPISVEIHPQVHRTMFELFLTIIPAGHAAEWPPIELVILNALSSELKAKTVEPNRITMLEFVRGRRVAFESTNVEQACTFTPGTMIIAKLDPQIFSNALDISLDRINK